MWLKRLRIIGHCSRLSSWNPAFSVSAPTRGIGTFPRSENKACSLSLALPVCCSAAGTLLWPLCPAIPTWPLHLSLKLFLQRTPQCPHRALRISLLRYFTHFTYSRLFMVCLPKSHVSFNALQPVISTVPGTVDAQRIFLKSISLGRPWWTSG